jgi:hypothetical protein
MTDLKRPVIRRSRFPFGHYRKRIVMAFEPGDIVAMRLERPRTWYRGSVAGVFHQLIIWQVEAKRREKRRAGKQKRAK